MLKLIIEIKIKNFELDLKQADDDFVLTVNEKVVLKVTVTLCMNVAGFADTCLANSMSVVKLSLRKFLLKFLIEQRVELALFLWSQHRSYSMSMRLITIMSRQNVLNRFFWAFSTESMQFSYSNRNISFK